MINRWADKVKNKIAHALVKSTKTSGYLDEIALINNYLASEQYQYAENLIRNLLSVEMYESELWELLGFCLEQLNPVEAKACYLRSVELEPSRVKSYLGLGMVNIKLKNLSEAVVFLKQAISINPYNFEAWVQLADVLYSLQKPDEAQGAYQKAINFQPENITLLCKHAICLSELSQWDASEAIFRKAINLDPNNEYTLNEFGLMYMEARKFSEAKEIFNRLMSLNQKNPYGYLGLAGVQLLEGDFLQAYRTQRLGLDVCDIEIVDVHRQMMNICSQLYGKEDEVSYHLSKVQEIAPESSHLNDSLLYLKDQQFAEAITILELYKQQNPADVTVEVNKALAFLLLGFYREGWPAYESRKLNNSMKEGILHSSRLIPLPFWDGSHIPDKTLVVVIEQGVGDCIHFVRYLTMVKDRVKSVILTCNKNIQRLFSTIPGITLASTIEEVINADYQILIMSLPMIFKTELNNIPNKVPYLTVERELANAWNKRLSPWARQLKVGLAWAGAAVFKGDLNRSTKLAQFSPIFGIKNVTFFSLQLGPQAEQIIEKPDGSELIDFTEHIKDFADTAAFINQLDIVISVDTSVAHLAGALAIPVWILLPYFPDHRWFLEREDSPWYPTARLFRQAKNRRWDDVFIKMAAVLDQVAIAENIQSRKQLLIPPHRNLIEEAESWLSEGRIAYAQANYENAKRAFERAIAVKPDIADAWYNLGLAYQLLNNPEVAKTCYRRVIAINPVDAGAYYNLGCIEAVNKNDQLALQYFGDSWRLDPTNPDVAYSFASLLWQVCDVKQGLLVQKAGLEIAPDHRLSWINYALLLAESADDDGSKKALDRAFSLPMYDDDELIAEEAEMLYRLGELDLSLARASLAAQLNPSNIKALLGLGFVHLKQGNLLEGWHLLEERLKVERKDQEKYTSEIWDGRDMFDHVLLVHAEQGLGDMLQCMRYVPLLKEKFKTIVVHIPKTLMALTQMIAGMDGINVSSDDIPQHDVRIPLMSIPLRLKTTLDTIPNIVPYFKITPDYVTKWSAFMGETKTKKRIGLAWTGGQLLASNQRRSIPTDLFKLLGKSKKVEWWSLQKDNQETLPENISLIDRMHLSANMADTAAIILQLDLVITVDTSIAHLAGALGKPVWILLAYNADYRWLIERDDSPWYPTARLFRQDKSYSWESVLLRVSEALNQWLG